MPTKPATKKTVTSKNKATKPVEKNTAVKKAVPDKVEHLVRDYLAKLREVDLTFENGAAVVEKYRSKYPELSNHIRRIVPEEHLIEIRPNLGDDADVRLFVIRLLDDEVRYEVILSGEEKHRAAKSSEWLSLLQNTLARLIARVIHARDTAKA